MTRCEEFCRAAPSCAPCDALDESFRRIDATRRAYTEGLDEDGRYAVLNGRRVRHPDD